MGRKIWRLRMFQAVNHKPWSCNRAVLVLGGSWDLISKVISTLSGVISVVTLIIALVTKSHDPLSRIL